MSTILDALKKSEQERKLTKLPTLSDMSAPQEQSRWPQILLIALLMLLLIILTWFGSRLLLGEPVGDSGLSNEIILSNETVDSANPSTASTESSDTIIVNVVSYSAQEEQRFAMINGKMYRENDFIKAGLKVEKINPDSVVFNLRGRRIVREP